MLDYNGNVVGVVSGKLNAMKVAEISRDMPQNVNFAIRSGGGPAGPLPGCRGGLGLAQLHLVAYPGGYPVAVMAALLLHNTL